MAQSQLHRFLERALAFAHAALESRSIERLKQVRDYLDVLGRVERLQMTLAEARQTVELLKQLRLLSDAADRQLLALVARN